MKVLPLMFAMFIAAVCAAPVSAQQQAGSTPQPAAVSEGQAALDKAAAAGKFALLFFWKEQNQQTDKAFGALTTAAASLADSATIVSIQVTNPAEKKIVDRYGVSRSPMPLVLAIAPCGAITKGFAGAVDEKQLRTAFVSPCTQLCLKAMQDRKLTFICVVEQADGQSPVAIPKGVDDFKADEKFGRATEVIRLNAKEPSEASFLKDLQVDPNWQTPVVVFMAPPGSVIGRFNASVTKPQLISKLTESQNNPCAGGKCGPGGCCPKK